MGLFLTVTMLVAGAAIAQSLTYDNVPDAHAIDRGALIVTGPPGVARTERFKIAQRTDGGFAIVSHIAAADSRYEATGTWLFDERWVAVGAAGRATVDGVTRIVEMFREGDRIEMTRNTVQADGTAYVDLFSVVCDDSCLMDMEPGALPMWVMTRHYRVKTGDRQTFQWVGVSLMRDAVLGDGKAQLWVNRTQSIAGGPVPAVVHWRFIEDIPDRAGGPTVQMQSHMWTDAQGRLRQFAVGRTEKPTTIGVRETDAAISAQMSAE
jgi:hypothetical protein